ncbi:MAG: hypothetical protein K6A92_12985 [Lachnospiraceae bacterium]|nr:hypothetical protein [Lachnospiraceae bacterium]
MQVCICSNQYGERKQLERLFQRSADRLIAAGEICYLHTYGSEGALLAEPMDFDLYMLDYQEEEGDVSGQKATALVTDLIRQRNLKTARFYLACPKPADDSPQIQYVKKPVTQGFVDTILNNRLADLKIEEEKVKQAIWEEEHRPPKNLKEAFYRWLNS